MAIYKGHEVVFKTVSKQHYADGCCPTCKECGKDLRHVISIDGEPYGHDCGAKLLGFNDAGLKMLLKANKEKRLQALFTTRERFADQFERCAPQPDERTQETVSWWVC